MVKKVRIKTRKDTRVICGKLITSHGYTTVDADKLEAFARTRMGKIIMDNCIEFEPKVDKTSKAALELASAQAENAEDKARIQQLEKENRELKDQVKKLTFELTKSSTKPTKAKKDKTEEIDPEDLKTDDQSDGFVFDPEKHTIEHRVAGKFFVMDENDDKVYGPLTEDEKAEFSAMIEG